MQHAGNISSHPHESDRAAAFYNLANARMAEGLVDDAIAGYQQALQLKPDYAEAYNNMGGALKARGDLAGAIASYRQAVRLKGDFAAAHNNLGNAVTDDGQPEAAIESYRRAIVIQPEYGTAYYNLANLYRTLGRNQEGIEAYQQAVRCQPDLAEAYSGLGHLHMGQGQVNEALASFQNALEIQPNLVDAWNSLGAGFMAQGQPEQAIDSYRKALQLMPGSAEVHCNLANAFLYLGQLEDAAVSCQKALGIKPDLADAYGCLGDIFFQKGRFGQAIACYQKIIALRPDGPIPYNNMGNAYRNLDKLEPAIACYQKALDLDPEFCEAQNNIVAPLQLTCDWKGLKLHGARLEALNETARRKGLRLPEDPFINLTRQADPARNFAVAQSWARDIAGQGRNLNCSFSFKGRRRKRAKITIGYLSNNFCDHPVAHQISGLFKNHNRDGFDIFCYSYGQDDGSVYRKQIERDCEKFVDLFALDHAASAARIYNDGVDILVDLVGLTNRNRLVISALRPAPVQISYLGILGTTGADFFDYVVTDKIVTPMEHQAFYSEKFIYMPHCYQINDNSRRIAPEKRVRSEFGLPEAGVVFCSFNNSYKFEPVMFDVWMRILRQVPGSVLWLSRGNAVADKNLKSEAQDRGVDPQRLIFAERLPLDEHLARLKLADLALDTRIYNGGATTSNALWASVPVITLLGSHFVSRMSASALAAVGLREMITHNLEEYEALAVQLATDPPLFDTPRFVRNLERAYQKIWQVYLDGQMPRPVEIGDDQHDARQSPTPEDGNNYA
jgi:protein O-GlcNAc transferase